MRYSDEAPQLRSFVNPVGVDTSSGSVAEHSASRDRRGKGAERTFILEEMGGASHVLLFYTCACASGPSVAIVTNTACNSQTLLSVAREMRV